MQMADIAVIFDLDGTLIDNNSFHLKAWQQFLTGSQPGGQSDPLTHRA